MSKIVRTKTRAEGGLTDAEREQMQCHAQQWIANAMQTGRTDRAALTEAIRGLYRVSGLAEPRVVIVPSPLVMAVASGIASQWWATRAATRAATLDATDAATRAATRAATLDATYAATLAATHDVTDDATYAATGAATRAATLAATRATRAATLAATRATRAATRFATDDATHAATLAATGAATRAATLAATDDATYAATLAATHDVTDDATYAATGDATDDAKHWIVSVCRAVGVDALSAYTRIRNWSAAYQGGNMWSAWDCYLTAARDILGLELESHAKYRHWEQAAKLGGFRYMHSEFCMVCDFPDVLNVDEENRPHCDDGPSHRWSDGWSLWYIHGVLVDEQIVMRPETQTVQQINSESNQDVRSIRIERYGWANYLRDSDAECIDYRKNDIEGTLEALYRTQHGDVRLVATCATGRVFAMGVPANIRTCEAAQEWLASGKKFRIVART